MHRPPFASARRTALRFVLHSFLNGLLVISPVAATAWILWKLFEAVDGLLPLPKTFAPGVGFALVVAIVIVVGIVASNFLAVQALALSDRLLGRVPFVKLVYSSIRDLTEAFVGQKKKFDRPVFISIGKDLETEMIGFVTRDDLSDLGRSGHVAVYVPQSYNFAANLLIVPSARVRPIDKPAAEMMAFAVSGGLTSTPDE